MKIVLVESLCDPDPAALTNPDADKVLGVKVTDTLFSSEVAWSGEHEKVKDGFAVGRHVGIVVSN